MSVRAETPQEWWSAGTYEVAPSVYRIPLPLPHDGLKAVNVYVLLGSDGVSVVDSGWAIPDSRRLLAQSLRVLGHGLDDIQRFLITHMHMDHYGQAIALRREHGTRVTLGSLERGSLERVNMRGRMALQEHIQYLRVLGAAELADELVARERETEPPSLTHWEFPDDWFGDADVLVVNGRTIDVVPTPGHTRGHVVFHDVSGGLLFAGDHVLPTITPSIGFEANLSPNPLGAFLASLALVRRRPDAVLLPAHGPVGPSVHRRVDELVQHHGRRLEETESAIARGADTGLHVAEQLKWTRHERSLAELDPTNQLLAVCETGAHIILLMAQGRVTKTVDDRVEHYSSV